MSRYIDADNLKERIPKDIHEDVFENCSNCELLDDKQVKELIDLQPTADVVEVEKVNKIYEKLADLFNAPCNFSPCDEIMLERERCREYCGNISDAECWKRYFEVVCDGERADK